jgi:hypothetical protein
VHDVRRAEHKRRRQRQYTHSQERRASARRGSVTHLHWPAYFAEPERCRRTAGLRQPLLVHDVHPAEKHRHLRCGNERLQGRRPSARRGSRIASATASVSCRTWMLACHGGLTSPALVLPCECLPTKKRFLRWTNACSQERRASARRGSVNRTLPRKNRTLCSGYRTPIQERRASARRGSVTLCNGVDSPRLAYASRSWCTNGRLMQHTLVAIWTRTFAGAAGVSSPWFGNAFALAGVFAEPKRPRRTAGLRQPLLVGSVSAARSMRIPSAGSIRFPGWLTLVSPKKEPRAPGAER